MAERPGVVGPCLVQKVPVGVAAGIVPWNVPLFITCMKLGAALAAGAPIVLKPSPEAPVELASCSPRCSSTRTCHPES